MRIGRGVLVGVGAGLALLAGGVPAGATIDNVKSFKLAYPGKEAKAYSCKACHQNAIGKKGDLNAYGLALQQFKTEAGAKKLTVEDYRAFEADDADNDGATNSQELEAGTDLNDPASVPEGIDSAEASHEEHHETEGEAEHVH